MLNCVSAALTGEVGRAYLCFGYINRGGRAYIVVSTPLGMLPKYKGLLVMYEGLLLMYEGMLCQQFTTLF